MKIAILLNCCHNPHIVSNIYHFFCKIIEKENFIIYLINNNENIKNEITKYKNICQIFKGNNNVFEFTGIQKCLEYLKTKQNIYIYDIFILITDALFNSPFNHLNFINLETIKYAINNEVCIGNIDSFGKEYYVDNFILDYWLRSNFIIINNKLFEKINYQFLSYKYQDVYNENDEMKIKIHYELMNKINDRLKTKKYKYLDNIKKLNIKKLCIINEWHFTKKIEKYGKVLDLFHIYEICNNKNNYINKNVNLINTSPMEQIKKRNEFLL